MCYCNKLKAVGSTTINQSQELPDAPATVIHLKALQSAPDITEAIFDECTHIVALFAVELFVKAL